MADGTNQFPWTQTIQASIARDALHILQGVVHEFDLGKTGTIRISGYPPGGPPEIFRSNDADVRRRTEVAKMLESRGVLRSVESRYVGGSIYIAEADTGQWLFVEADEQTVRDCVRELEGRFKPKSATAYRDREAQAPPKESDPLNKEIKRTHKIEQAKLPYAIIAPVVAAVIIAIFGFVFRWWQHLIKMLGHHS